MSIEKAKEIHCDCCEPIGCDGSRHHECPRLRLVAQEAQSKPVEQSNSGPDNLPDIDSFNEGTSKPGKLESGRCKHSMNDLMVKAGIASTCPICMQDIIDRQAKQLKDWQSTTCEGHDPLKEDILPRACPYCEVGHLVEQLAAKDKEIERLKGVIDCYERKPASVECSNCGEVIRTV